VKVTHQDKIYFLFNFARSWKKLLHLKMERILTCVKITAMAAVAILLVIIVQVSALLFAR